MPLSGAQNHTEAASHASMRADMRRPILLLPTLALSAICLVWLILLIAHKTGIVGTGHEPAGNQGPVAFCFLVLLWCMYRYGTRLDLGSDGIHLTHRWYSQTICWADVGQVEVLSSWRPKFGGEIGAGVRIRHRSTPQSLFIPDVFPQRRHQLAASIKTLAPDQPLS